MSDQGSRVSGGTVRAASKHRRVTTPPVVGRVTAAAAAWSALFAHAPVLGPGRPPRRAGRHGTDLRTLGVPGVRPARGRAVPRGRRAARRPAAGAPAIGTGLPAVVLALRLGAAALLLRAAVGLVGDVVLLVGGEARATMLFDVWFLLGAVLFARAVNDRGDESAQQRTRRPLMRGGA